jgi:hypothetical protein
MGKGRDEGNEIHVTDIVALKSNSIAAVDEFAQRYLSLPRMTMDCEVMDQRQLRDAMGLRATVEYGDPWPAAEQELMRRGFRWHMLGGTRVMYLRERECPDADDGWSDGEEIND